jgi:hypothetical protein
MKPESNEVDQMDYQYLLDRSKKVNSEIEKLLDIRRTDYVAKFGSYQNNDFEKVEKLTRNLMCAAFDMLMFLSAEKSEVEIVLDCLTKKTEK